MEERLSWRATAVFGVTAVGGVVVPALRVPAALVAVAMFLAGPVLMAVALVLAARRSREVAVTIGGLFFLQDAAPKSVQRNLLGSLAAQVALGLATAAARPNTSSALGVLAPVAGLGLSGLWGARHGTFAPRETPS
ncbi:MAG: hypothetical protein QOI61_1129 [Actinomycetota bacterium]